MGPGLTILDGYQRTNALQNQEGAQQLQQAVTGLALVEKIRQAQQEAAKRRAFENANGDYGALQTELLKQGDVANAERIGKMQSEREYQTQIGALVGPDGSVDSTKLARVLALKNPGALATMESDRIKREENRRAVGALQGGGGDTLALPTPPAPAANAGRAGTLDNFLDTTPTDLSNSPVAPVSTPSTGGALQRPTQARGPFASYADHEDPVVRGLAASGTQALGAFTDPDKAAAHVRSVQDQISRHLDRVETRRSRESEAEKNREFRQTIASLRQSNDPKATSLMQNIDFLIQRGIAKDAQDAYTMLRTGAAKPENDAILGLAQTLFKAGEHKYRKGGMQQAIQDARAIIESSRGAMGGRPAAPAAPAPMGALPGSFSEGAGAGYGLGAPAMAGGGSGAVNSAGIPQGVPQGSRQIGTSGGKPVFQAPDGKRYIVE